MIFQCSFCNYITDRKFNLQRHIGKKHNDIDKNNDILQNGQNDIPKEQNDIPNRQNDIPKRQNDIPSSKNDIPCEFICKKCNKLYKTLKHLKTHELKCKKVDNLTCPKCMISFTHRNNKNRHIKANKCNARSIIHARTPNIQNITNNNITNNNNIQNNFIINNFGSERIDHISHEDIVKMLTSGQNTIPMFIEKKHFDKQFPENNNIKYTLENKCKIFEDNKWKEKDIGLLSSSLVHDNTEILLLYCDSKDKEVLNTIQDIDKYENVKNKLFILYNKTDSAKYNTIIAKIKDLIKNCELQEIDDI